MGLSSLLDDRFEAVGAEAFRMAPTRAAIALALTLTAGFTVGWTQALSWAFVLAIVEIWLYFVTRPMGKPGASPGLRRHYFWATILSVPVWTAFGLILWLTPRTACQVAALAFWAGQLLYAQNFAARSPVSVAQIGGPSLLAPLLIPLIVPRFHGADQVLVMTMLGLCMAHAINATLMNMRAARALAEATSATLRARDQAESASQENVRRAAEMEALAGERLIATQQAEAAHNWLARAVEAMNEAVAFFDETDRLIIWNDKYAELVGPARDRLAKGASSESVIGAVVDGSITEGEDGGSSESSPALSWDESASRHVQLRDGRWIQLDNRALPQGARIITAIDITDLKNREESFRLLFDANPVAMVVFDPETLAVLRVNESLVKQFGRGPQDLEGVRLTDFVALEDREAAVQNITRGAEGGLNASYSVLDGFGRYRQVQPYIRPLQYNDRPALICAVLDTTERAEALEALAGARDAAETANRAKSEFLATMSHEIRTPLNGVLGMVQAMQRDALSKQQRERLDVIGQSGQTLLTILNDILDLSKIEAGKLELEEVQFELEPLMVGVQETFKPLAANKGLDFSLEVEALARGAYRGDHVRVRQILFNLISNAVKFTAVGSVKVRVGIADDGRVRFSVTDTGAGVAPDQIERLFEKFVQADSSTTRRFGGTGLGLSICRELCRAMGGEISAQSEVGRGSCFIVELPLARADGVGLVETATVAPAMALDERRLRILAAEDNDMNQLVLKTLLGQIGLEPVMVSNGEDAVAAWERGDWDVILMDVQMPVMDGVAAARQIRRREAETGRPTTPIIALTANAMTHQAESYLAAGMNGFVAKPIEVAQLFAAISAAVQGEDENSTAAA